jgi:hypothetical protein
MEWAFPKRFELGEEQEIVGNAQEPLGRSKDVRR